MGMQVKIQSNQRFQQPDDICSTECLGVATEEKLLNRSDTAAHTFAHSSSSQCTTLENKHVQMDLI